MDNEIIIEALQQLLESDQEPKQSRDQIKAWLDSMGINNYTINPDLSVDVDGDVALVNKGLKSIPIQFGAVNGNFDCNYNQLTSLQGGPREVGGNFDCSYNKFTSEPDISHINIGGGFRWK
jgi:hypothetical protein